MQCKNCFYKKKLPLYKCCTKIKAVYKLKTVFKPHEFVPQVYMLRKVKLMRESSTLEVLGI